MDKMLVSRFKGPVSKRFLNLMPNYDWYVSVLKDIKLGINSEEWVRAMTFTMDVWLERTLKIYPILLVCYSQVYSKSAVFKPEYIFPQLLMQWLITKPEYDGIKYMSNKCTPAGDWRNEFVNYAIPVKRVQSVGYCTELVGKFMLTKPLSLEILKLTNPLHIPDVISVRDSGNIDTTSQINKFNIAGSEYDYDTSAFKLLERSIAKQPYIIITP